MRSHGSDGQAVVPHSEYGLSKLKPILNGFAAGKSPTIYQDGEALYIHVPRGQPYEANFFQIPVIIRSVTDLGAGTIMQADVVARSIAPATRCTAVYAW